MKKMGIIALIWILSYTLSGCGLVRTMTCIQKEKLNLFNWGEYIDPSLISGFEKANNVCVILSTYESNESAIEQLRTQSFDVIVPSDYAIEQMVEEDMIQSLDWEKITGFNPTIDMTPGLLTILSALDFDLLDYGVPYFWGNVGIMYNKNIVTLNELETLEWNIFKSNTYKIAFYDSARDSFMVALKSLGYSMNTNTQIELNEAENWLLELARKKNVDFFTSDISDAMVSLSYDIALVYSGDAVYLMSEQDSLEFFVPTTGTNVWVDALVIPKNAKNTALAYAFINYVSTQTSAQMNSAYVMYSSPRKDVYEAMISETGDFYAYRSAYAVSVNSNDEVLRHSLTIKAFVTDAWIRIRAL